MNFRLDDWTDSAEQMAENASLQTEQFLAGMKHMGLAQALSNLRAANAKINELRQTVRVQEEQITRLQGKVRSVNQKLEKASNWATSAEQRIKALEAKQ